MSLGKVFFKDGHIAEIQQIQEQGDYKIKFVAENVVYVCTFIPSMYDGIWFDYVDEKITCESTTVTRFTKLKVTSDHDDILELPADEIERVEIPWEVE